MEWSRGRHTSPCGSALPPCWLHTTTTTITTKGYRRNIRQRSGRWLLVVVILFCHQIIIKSLAVGCRYTFLLSNYPRIVGWCLSLYFFVIKRSSNRWLLLVVILFRYQIIIESLVGACHYTFLLSNYHKTVGCCLPLYFFCQTIIKSSCGVHSRVQWNATRVSHALVMNLLSSHPLQVAMPSSREVHPHRGRPSIAAKNKRSLVTRSLNKCLV